MKKILLTILLILCFLIALTGCNQSTESALVGKWTCSTYDSDNEATIVFEKGEDGLIGEITLIDEDNDEWSKNSFQVESIENFTIKLLLDNGKIEKSSFAISKDTLIIFGSEFKNSDKNIKIERDDTYIIDGVIMPVIEDVFFGMTSTEFKNTDFYNDNCSSYSSEYLDLPDWFYPSVDGFVSYNFDEESGKLNSLEFFFDKDTDTKTEKLKNNIIDAYSSQFGNYTTREWGTQDYTEYTWTSGNMLIEFCDQTREDGNIAYTLCYKLSY